MRAHRRRGTAIVEFAVTIPLLGLVLLGTFFFGWSLTNQQHVRASARYVAWRYMRTLKPVPVDQVNAAFFYSRTKEPPGIGLSSGPTDTLNEYVDSAGQVSKPAGDLAHTAVITKWPYGVSVTASAEFNTTLKAYERFKGAIYSKHARDGVEWRCGHASIDGAITDAFLEPLDSVLSALPAPADGLADIFQNLYTTPWRPWWR